jgi:hypothetical protein
VHCIPLLKLYGLLNYVKYLGWYLIQTKGAQNFPQNMYGSRVFFLTGSIVAELYNGFHVKQFPKTNMIFYWICVNVASLGLSDYVIITQLIHYKNRLITL